MAFGGTYFRDIYSGVNGKWYRKSWKEFNELKNIDQNYYCSDYCYVNVNKYKIKCGTSLRFWENKSWINFIDHYGWFQWYFRYWLGRMSLDYERQIATWNGIISKFKSKLVEMTKDVNSRFDYYCISTKIRQVLLYRGYKILEDDFLWFIFGSYKNKLLFAIRQELL